MSLPSSAANPGPVQKQGTNVYTMMLILSFLFLCVACTLLYLELQNYGQYPWWRVTGGAGS